MDRSPSAFKFLYATVTGDLWENIWEETVNGVSVRVLESTTEGGAQ